MAMQYINYVKAKTNTFMAPKSETPVLSEEDEQFLNQITSEENPPALPPRPGSSLLNDAPRMKDAQVALMDGAQNIPLPETPQEVAEEPAMAADPDTTPKKQRFAWSWLRRDSRDSKRDTTADGLAEIAQVVKDADAQPNEDNVVEAVEAKKEEEDMAIVLEKLNLAAVNNRVFSISDETQELLQKFNQVFKDLVNGVPTAYDDLEKLLTNGDRQLQKTYNTLPGFLQKLIEKLPETMTKGLAPEMMAAAAARSGLNMENAGKAAGAAGKMGIKVPSLKDLTGKPAAMAGMLRSIITYLRARFPAFIGMNVLWSLAMFGKHDVLPASQYLLNLTQFFSSFSGIVTRGARKYAWLRNGRSPSRKLRNWTRSTVTRTLAGWQPLPRRELPWRKSRRVLKKLQRPGASRRPPRLQPSNLHRNPVQVKLNQKRWSLKLVQLEGRLGGLGGIFSCAIWLCIVVSAFWLGCSVLEDSILTKIT